MLPQKILKSRGLECYFQRFPRAICHLCISRIIYFVNTCNVNYKIENRLSLNLETSKCLPFQSHHSKFEVIKLSERLAPVKHDPRGFVFFFQYLMLRASDLVSMMTSKLVRRSFDFNRSICHQYDHIVSRITSTAKTTDELVDLEKYIDNLRSGPLVHLKVG